jgi:hypothetical protein
VKRACLSTLRNLVLQLGCYGLVKGKEAALQPFCYDGAQTLHACERLPTSCQSIYDDVLLGIEKGVPDLNLLG